MVIRVRIRRGAGARRRVRITFMLRSIRLGLYRVRNRNCFPRTRLICQKDRGLEIGLGLGVGFGLGLGEFGTLF